MHFFVIMKHNWEYKKLGDLCDIVRGGSPRPIQDYLTSDKDGLNWIKIGDVSPGEKYIISTKEKIKKEGLKKTRAVYKGDFILSNSMSFGRPYILKIDGCIHDGWLAIKNVESHFIPDFLYYYLSSPSTYLLFVKLVRGGVVNNLNSDIVRGISVPVPPREVQEQIVAELDTINEGITELKEQIKDFDNLGQTLFYETFGDPISNPKGWEVKKLLEVSPISPSIQTPLAVNGKFWLLNLDQIESQTGKIIEKQYFKLSDIGNSTTMFDEDNVLYSKLRPYLNKVVVPDSTGYGSSELLPFRPKKEVLSREYLARALRSNEFVEHINEKTGGAKMPRVKMEYLRNFLLPVPPLPLQKQFAEQIEAIEKMKVELEAQIADAQTLLDSRMDYWFN